MNPAATLTAAYAEADARAAFIRKTYAHLAGALALFAGLEYLLITSPLGEQIAGFVFSARYGFLMLLGGFILTGWLARGFAQRIDSPAAQYAGLILYVLAQAVIFVPLIYMAVFYSSPDLLQNAALLTGFLFAGLSAVCFITRKDFSFLRGILAIGGMVALGLIVCSIFFGFTLGLAFSAGMILLACTAILYDTSKVIHHYPVGSHVAASLELFASVALLFWYVLRLLMSLNRR
ncbi:MAG TPA: Bax inhibitor-1 family protein [Tichowtungia sp.]|nr:Bax inhibitor-1 family protein [Tichowtungia sp.]